MVKKRPCPKVRFMVKKRPCPKVRLMVKKPKFLYPTRIDRVVARDSLELKSNNRGFY